MKKIKYDHVASQIKNKIRDLVKQQQIIKIIIINQFLNVISKTVKDENKNDLINLIADAYSKEKRAYESNEKNTVDRKILTNEVLQTLHILQLFKEQQNQRDQNFMSCLKKYQNFIKVRMLEFTLNLH